MIMTDEQTPDTELDAIVSQLEAARLVEQCVNEDGKAAMRLTEQGVRVGRQWRWPAMRTLRSCWTRCWTTGTDRTWRPY